MSFGYCDFSAHSHFQSISQNNKYKPSCSIQIFSKPKPAIPRHRPLSMVETRTSVGDSTATNPKSRRMTWATEISKRASWFSVDSNKSSCIDPDAFMLAANHNNLQDMKAGSRTRSLINGCLERVKGIRRARHSNRHYSRLGDF